MNNSNRFVPVLILMCCSVAIFGQTPEDKIASAFGDPFQTVCVVKKDSSAIRYCQNYNFSDSFMVGITSDNEHRVLQIYLFAKGTVEDLDRPISSEDKQRFLKKVDQIRPLGTIRSLPVRSIGTSLGSDTWEIFDGALVQYISSKKDGNNFGLTWIFVYFPFKVTGMVTGTDAASCSVKGTRICGIFIDGVKYLTMEKDIKLGTAVTLSVINP